MTKLRNFALAGTCSLVMCAGLIAACAEEITDTPDTDGGSEAGTDGGKEGQAPGPDASDGGKVDAPFDAGFDAPPFDATLPDYVADLENAMCRSLTRCCFGDENTPDGGAVDGGTYNRAKCSDAFKAAGFEFSALGSDLIDGGTVTIDPVNAIECANRLNGLSCNLTGEELTATRRICYDALVGTRGQGQPCTSAIECQRGHYCQYDGGTCQPLAGDGGACGIYAASGNDLVNSARSEEACSWRGSGDTKLRCDSYDFVNFEYRPKNEWFCRPTVPLGQQCNSTVWCDNGICDELDFYYCKSPVDYFRISCPTVVDPPQGN